MSLWLLLRGIRSEQSRVKCPIGYRSETTGVPPPYPSVPNGSDHCSSEAHKTCAYSKRPTRCTTGVGDVSDRYTTGGESARLRRSTRGRKRGMLQSKGVLHVRASFNNTLVTVADVRGQVVYWVSAGTCGFGGARKGSAFAAQTAAGNAIRLLSDGNVERVEVLVTGPGPGRETALRAICASGVGLHCIRDTTPMPHNGCRPPANRFV